MAEENRRLREEVAELRRINEILRAASRIRNGVPALIVQAGGEVNAILKWARPCTETSPVPA
jgi:hypothetical protein